MMGDDERRGATTEYNDGGQPEGCPYEIFRRKPTMIRRNLFLATAFGVALTLILGASAPARSALTVTARSGRADDAMSARLEVIAGAGMYGTHTFEYLTQLSDDIGARVTGSAEAARAVQWGVDTRSALRQPVDPSQLRARRSTAAK